MRDVKSKRSFVYRERGDDAYKKRATQKGGKRDGIFKDGFEVFSPKIDANNRVRILPPTWEDPDHYGLDVWVHYQIGNDNSAYVCPRNMKDMDCPVCEEILVTKGDKEYVNKIKAKRKVLVWLIDRDDEDAGPKLWAMPWTMDKTFVLQCTDDETGKPIKIDKPQNGYDVSFKTVKGGAGEGIAYKYEGEKVARKESPIHADPKKMEKWLDYIEAHPLPEVILYRDYDYIKKVYDGGIVKKNAEEWDNDEDDDIPMKPEKGTHHTDPVDDDEKENEPGYTVEDLKSMSRDELEDLAIENGIKPKFIAKMDDDDLVETVAEALGVEEENDDDDDDGNEQETPNNKLEELKKKYGKK